MKYKNGKALVAKHFDGKTCKAIYKIVKGSVVTLWEFIPSCFGRGFWINVQPWLNDEAWRNNV